MLVNLENIFNTAIGDDSNFFWLFYFHPFCKVLINKVSCAIAIQFWKEFMLTGWLWNFEWYANLLSSACGIWTAATNSTCWKWTLTNIQLCNRPIPKPCWNHRYKITFAHNPINTVALLVASSILDIPTRVIPNGPDSLLDHLHSSDT